MTATRHICQEWSNKEANRTPRPRIIAMTANPMKGDREECLEAGMDDYISKPIHVEELIQALTRGVGSLSPIDTNVLQSFRDMVGKNAELILTEMIDCYVEDAPKLLQAMASAFAQGDVIALRQAAHTLKSSSATLGATTLSHLCKELEAHSHSGNIDLGLEKVLRLVAEYERVKAVLQKERPLAQL